MRVTIELEKYEVNEKLDFCLNVVDWLKKSKDFDFVSHRIDDLALGKKRVVINVPTTPTIKD